MRSFHRGRRSALLGAAPVSIGFGARSLPSRLGTGFPRPRAGETAREIGAADM
jgi:hypothetical protein